MDIIHSSMMVSSHKRADDLKSLRGLCLLNRGPRVCSVQCCLCLRRETAGLLKEAESIFVEVLKNCRKTLGVAV